VVQDPFTGGLGARGAARCCFFFRSAVLIRKPFFRLSWAAFLPIFFFPHAPSLPQLPDPDRF